ncbi:MAG: DUF4158 domain-containing protein [Ahniella sp.]|nr:DUF4158 domain-containing protein [Ahniella sp.]
MKTTKRESNYRTLPTDIGDLALKRNYTPSAGDKHFLDRTVSRRWSHLAVAIHLMVFRNLGYFVPLARVPDRIRTHIASCLGLVRMPPPSTLEKYDTSGSKRTHIEALRAYLGVKPFRKESEAWLFDVALRAAETKHDVSDIISVLCEELVHHAYEIPAFEEVLKKTADRAQRQVTDQHLGRIATALTPATRKVIDELLTRRPGDILTGWQQLKREPRAPSPHEARAMLHHMQRLKHLADQMPAVDIPQPKLRAYRHWARALDATELSRLQPGRRYGLAVIYIHAQRGQAVDDIIEVFLRLMQNLDNTARRNLLAYQIQNSERADELVGQLKALLVAYQKKGSNRRRFLAMESALIRDALSLEEACDEHLAFAGKNYLPFLLNPYGSVRGQLLDCLEFAGIQSADDQSPTWHWLQRLLGKLRHMRKVEVTCAQLGVEPSDLDWLSEFWPKQVLLRRRGRADTSESPVSGIGHNLQRTRRTQVGRPVRAEGRRAR